MVPNDERFKFADPQDDPRTNPRPQTPGLVEELEKMGFRPFDVEW